MDNNMIEDTHPEIQAYVDKEFGFDNVEAEVQEPTLEELLRTTYEQLHGEALDSLRCIPEDAAADEKKARKRDVRQWAHKIKYLDDILDEDLYWITKNSGSYYYDPHSKNPETRILQIGSMHRKFGLYFADDKTWMDEVMKDLNRMRNDSIYSFKHHPNMLNLLTTKNWLKPIDEPHHSVFDILIKSLSNGRKPESDHIKEVIVRKYFHPEDYMIPCLCLYGAGGTGKNTLVNKVLYTIHDGSTKIGSFERLLDTYQDSIVGQTYVMFDESAHQRARTMQLKEIVGNETITVRQIYIGQKSHDNTAAYMVAANADSVEEVPINLVRGGEDRRWSPIYSDKNIMYWLLHAGLDIDWWRAHLWRLDDPTELSKWLNSIIKDVTKNGNPNGENPVYALHGDDYDAASKATTKFVIDDWIEDFLTDAINNKINSVSASTIFEEYKEWVVKDGEAPFTGKATAFGRKVSSVVKSRRLNWESKVTNVNGKSVRTWYNI